MNNVTLVVVLEDDKVTVRLRHVMPSAVGRYDHIDAVGNGASVENAFARAIAAFDERVAAIIRRRHADAALAEKELDTVKKQVSGCLSEVALVTEKWKEKTCTTKS